MPDTAATVLGSKKTVTAADLPEVPEGSAALLKRLSREQWANPTEDRDQEIKVLQAILLSTPPAEPRSLNIANDSYISTAYSAYATNYHTADASRHFRSEPGPPEDDYTIAEAADIAGLMDVSEVTTSTLPLQAMRKVQD